MRSIISLVLLAVALLPVQARAQAVSIPAEYSKKIKAATQIEALNPESFGNSTTEVNGRTVFTNVDIDLPGNNTLPVRFGRRLTIDLRYMPEELGGLGNWDIDVPYIEGTFSKYYGWSVAAYNSPNRYKRCTLAGAPMVEGAIFTAEEVFHGYSIHVPGVYDGQMMADAQNYADPTDGANYPWILDSMARVGCLPSMKNGYPGEGFVLKLTDGTKYYFDYAVERELPTLRKAAKYVPGYSMERKRIFMLATRIEDRFGNYVDYQYANGALTGIIASDGRQITVQSNQAAGTFTATANGRDWTYTLQNGHLATVRNPDGSKWSYSPFGSLAKRPDVPGDGLALEAFLPENFCLDQSSPYGGEFSFNVTHPGGATAKFDFVGQNFYRSYVPYMCMIDFFDHQVRLYSALNIISNGGNWGQTLSGLLGLGDVSEHENPAYFDEEVSGVAHIMQPNFFGVYSLKGQTISGAGMAQQVTTYDYQNEPYPYCDQYSSVTGEFTGVRCNQDPCPAEGCTDSVGRWITITMPSGDKVRKRFGVVYGKNEGKLLAEQVVSAAGAVVKEVVYRHFDETTINGQVFPKRIGWMFTSDPMGGLQLPLISVETRESGETFVWEVSTCGSATVYCFDAFARPTKVLKTNSLGHHKFEVAEYHDDTTLWVIGLPKRVYVPDTSPNNIGNTQSMIVSEIQYDSRAQPLRVYDFGKLKQTFGYWPNGMVKTVADGKGNVTTFADYHRGVPRSITHPGASEAPSGSVISATVDNNGWITSVTSEIGAKTCYAYDAMGRMSNVLYPSEAQVGLCDQSRWDNRYSEFRQLAEGEWMPSGLPMSRWRQYVSEGNHITVTYMDAMWRPVLVHDYDATNVGPTLRSMRTAYDADGRVSFESYPVSDLIPALVGKRMFYDALDRVVRTEQDSEHGVLASTSEYLSGLRIRTTNPRGHQSITQYMAWDAPQYDLPISSIHPEGKVIEISRHPRFGWPLRLTQRSADYTQMAVRSYVYDGSAQVCKTIEPETGASVKGYDAAGNLAWGASGLNRESYGSLSDCQQAAAWSTGLGVTREYDPRNRLTKLKFPGGRGDQIWTYTADSLPASITAYNDAASQAPVVNAYTYNNRRLLTGESSSQPGWYTWSIGYDYDRIGGLRGQTYPTGRTLYYDPNALGLATGVRDQSGQVYASGASYYPNGAIKQFTYGNGLVHTMSQNERQLPVRVTATGNAMDYDYAYDRNGNIERIYDYVTGTPTARHRWMAYDALDRLTSVASAVFGGSDHAHRFTYDALDNLKSWKHAGVKDYAEYIYDANNRLTSIRNTAGATVVGLDYDPQGNLHNKNGQGYQFDYGNRLRAVDNKEAYRYDGLGRRVLNWRYPTPTAPSGTTSLSMYSQSGQLIYEEDHHGSPVTTKENIYLAGSVISIREIKWGVSDEVKYQHTDILGSPVAVTNAAGQVTERMDYEPWGAIIGKPNHNGIGYTGHMTDGATGLTYMQQRYYDPTMGIFLSVDPVVADPKNGEMFNRYNYAFNNPYRYSDPDGRSPVRVGATLLKLLYKAYKQYKKYGDINAGTLKKIGVDEIAGIADDLKVIFSGSGSTLDILLAAVDLVTGLDTNNKATRAARAARSGNSVTAASKAGKQDIQIAGGYRTRTDPSTPGEGGSHTHVYNPDNKEVARVNGFGGYSERHGGRLLSKPSELPKDVRNDINRVVRNRPEGK